MPSFPTSAAPVITIVGPTASGKTGLAIDVARRLGGEIISMDSRQAYRGFEIGTAAPTLAERDAAPHHGVGFLDPCERYGAGRFVRRAAEWLGGIEARGGVPILAGGTGLFLRALTHPMFEEPALDPARRARLDEWLGGSEGAELSRWAVRLDPQLVGRAAPLDRQRASRTVELALLTGSPLSWWMANGPSDRPPLPTRVYVLEVPPEILRDRIRRRTRDMLAGGAWQDEVERIVAEGLQASRAFDAVGYADVAALVGGEISVSETVDRVFAATWQYARRQRTWFRHKLPEGSIVLDGSMPSEQLGRLIVDGHE